MVLCGTIGHWLIPGPLPKAGLKSSQPCLRASQLGLRASQPGLVARPVSQQARPADPHASPKGPVSKAQESPKTQESPGAQDPWADCLFLSLLEGTTEYTNIWKISMGFCAPKEPPPKNCLIIFPLLDGNQKFPQRPSVYDKRSRGQIASGFIIASQS